MAVENDMNVFTSDIDNFPDIATDFLWQAVIIPEAGTPLATMIESFGGTKQFTLRCRAANLPQRTIETLETHWQGSKKVMPGRTKMDGVCTLKFDEFKDWKTSHMFHAWMNLIHNCNIGRDGGDAGALFPNQMTGAAVSNYMKDYSAKIKLTCFDARLKRGDPHDYTMYYCWPKDMDAANLNQEGNGKITRTIQMQYSTFQETNPEEYENQ